MSKQETTIVDRRHEFNPNIDKAYFDFSMNDGYTYPLDHRIIVPEGLSVHNQEFAYIKSQELLLNYYGAFCSAGQKNNKVHNDFVRDVIRNAPYTGDDRFNWHDNSMTNVVDMLNANANNMAERTSALIRRDYPYFKWPKDNLMHLEYIHVNGFEFDSQIYYHRVLSDVMKLAKDGLFSWSSIYENNYEKFKDWLQRSVLNDVVLEKADGPGMKTGVKLFALNRSYLHSVGYHNKS